MTDTEGGPRKPGRPGAGKAPLVDAASADELLAKAQAQGVELLGPDGLLSQVTKPVLERALEEELTDHLGHEKHDAAGRGSGNSRNGATGKSALGRVRAVPGLPGRGAARVIYTTNLIESMNARLRK